MRHKAALPGDQADGGRGSSHVWGNLQTVAWDRATNTLSAGSDPRSPVGAAKVVAAPAAP
jgi:gamma-glutamyltranspeptidase/glutathione hydrolase